MPFTSSVALIAGLAVVGVVPVKDDCKAPVVTDAVWQAPVGHRQPTQRDLPPNIRRDEGARTQGESTFDKSLQICRGC